MINIDDDDDDIADDIEDFQNEGAQGNILMRSQVAAISDQELD